MSAYNTVKTRFKDGELLIEALKSMGFNPRNCIGHREQLEGYQGDKRKDVADIIIPRSQVGHLSNDIGFVKGEDGSFGAVISEYDSTKYNSVWLSKLKIQVADQGILRQAKRAGFRIGERRVLKDHIEYQFLRA